MADAAQKAAKDVVSFGDITEVNLNKMDIFPLSHLNISNVVIDSQFMTFTLQILCADIVDYTKEVVTPDQFYGVDNLQDVLNTQLQVVNDIQQELRRGGLFDDNLQITTDITASPFMDNFENQLAGWAATINIEMPNNEHTIC